MKTVKLYDINPYRDEFEATVVSCTEKDGKFEAVFDETLFFPEEGGQDADKGVIYVTGVSKEIPVLDVRIKEDVIYHIIDTPLEAGCRIKGKIDYKRRFDYMQQHSGEHIISGLAHNLYGCENVGFHLSEREVTLDFDKLLSDSEVRELELKANECIHKDIPVKAYYPTDEELSGLNYRSKKELTGPVRIVEIEGTDMCACCAPHVKRTGQIGSIKFKNWESHRGGMRITICCGQRAVLDHASLQDIVSQVSAKLSAPAEKVPEALNQAFEERDRVNDARIRMQERYINLLFETSEKTNGNIIIFGDELDTKAMRDAVNKAVKEVKGYVGIFSGDDERGYNFVIGSESLDCRELAKTLREKLKAGCGGSAPQIQGSVKATALEIRGIF